jgi:hypothetical protein
MAPRKKTSQDYASEAVQQEDLVEVVAHVKPIINIKG